MSRQLCLVVVVVAVLSCCAAQKDILDSLAQLENDILRDPDERVRGPLHEDGGDSTSLVSMGHEINEPATSNDVLLVDNVDASISNQGSVPSSRATLQCASQVLPVALTTMCVFFGGSTFVLVLYVIMKWYRRGGKGSEPLLKDGINASALDLTTLQRVILLVLSLLVIAATIAVAVSLSSTQAQVDASMAAAASSTGSAASGSAVRAGSSVSAPPVPGNWRLVWADEFNSYNSTNWLLRTDTYGDGLQQFQIFREQNCIFSGGTVKLVAKREDFGGRKYTSCMLWGKPARKYGYIEGRMRLPVGEGIWPAFWMGPNPGCCGSWPKSGEIDIMELYGARPNQPQADAHWYCPGAGHQHKSSSTTGFRLPNGGTARDWHVYAVEWSRGSMKFYIDGRHYHTIDRICGRVFTDPFDSPYFLKLNNQVGDGEQLRWPARQSVPAPMPSTMEVDWVRWWQKSDVPTNSPTTRTATNTPTSVPPPSSGLAHGQFPCSTTRRCQSGLKCVRGNGHYFNQPRSTPVCVRPRDSAYCSVESPCNSGQGDCDTSSECVSGLRCVQRDGWDVCQ